MTPYSTTSSRKKVINIDGAHSKPMHRRASIASRDAVTMCLKIVAGLRPPDDYSLRRRSLMAKALPESQTTRKASIIR